MDLKWEKPANDGGAPITAYIVEKKDRDTGKWVKAVEVRVLKYDSVYTIFYTIKFETYYPYI